MKGVKVVKSKGRVYLYDRATGKRIEKSNSQTFAKDTLGALIQDYKRSPEYVSLATRTKELYNQAFDYLKPLTAGSLSSLDKKIIIQIRNLAFEQRKRGFANNIFAVLRLLSHWALTNDLIDRNPTAGIKFIPRPKDLPIANRAWSDEECDTMLSNAKSGVKTAIALGMYAGMRIGDVVKISWSAYDGNSIQWTQTKTGNPVWLPAHRDLKMILDSTPRKCVTIVASELDRPYTIDGLAGSYARLRSRLQAQGLVAPGLSFHGLRHTAARRLADAGCDPRTIAAMLGHKSLAMAIHYSSEFDNKKRAMAAVTVLENHRRK